MRAPHISNVRLRSQMSERFNRWQGLAIGQMSVAIALLSGISVAAMGLCLSLVQNTEFVASLRHKSVFLFCFAFFGLCAICSCLAVITRSLDFRLTARAARAQSNPDYKRPLSVFRLSSGQYGNLTWFFFWAALFSLAIAATLLSIVLWSVYGSKLRTNEPIKQAISYDARGWTQETTGSAASGPWLNHSPPGTRYYRDSNRTIYRLYPPGVKPNAEPANPFGLCDSAPEIPK